MGHPASQVTCVRETHYNSGSRVPPALPKPAPQGLTKGDIAGITIGSVAGVALILAFIFWLWARRKVSGRQGRESQEELTSVKELEGAVLTEADSGNVNELPLAKDVAVEMGPRKSWAELAANKEMRHEMAGSSPEIVELPSAEPVELAAGDEKKDMQSKVE